MHEQQHDRPHAERARGDAFSGPRLELPRFHFASTTSLARPAAQAAPAPVPAPTPQPAPQPVAPHLKHFTAPQPQHFAAPQPQYSATQHHVAAPQPQYAMPQHAAPQPHAQPAFSAPQYAPRPVAPAPVQAPAPQQFAPAAPAVHANATAMSQPVAVTYAAPPQPQRAPQPVAPQRPAMRQPLAANTTRPAATVSWDRIETPSEPSLLQRISPVHMGVLLIIVMIVMIASAGPATMNAAPARLPALASGGGTSGDPMMQPRTGVAAARTGANAASKAAPAASKAAPASRNVGASRARVRTSNGWIIVGNARVKRTVRAGGIPSPAAAANLAVAGGGRVSANSTDAVQMRGIPSPAAAENLGPKSLPYRPTDGVTLPRMVGERDSYGVDSHYGRDTLPMEAAVATPALTPGQSADQAQQRASVQHLSGNEDYAPAVNGGLITAY